MPIIIGKKEINSIGGFMQNVPTPLEQLFLIASQNGQNNTCRLIVEFRELEKEFCKPVMVPKDKEGLCSLIA